MKLTPENLKYIKSIQSENQKLQNLQEQNYEEMLAAIGVVDDDNLWDVVFNQGAVDHLKELDFQEVGD